MVCLSRSDLRLLAFVCGRFSRPSAFTFLIAIRARNAVHDFPELAGAVSQAGGAAQRFFHASRIAIGYLAQFTDGASNLPGGIKMVAIRIRDSHCFLRNAGDANTHFMRRASLFTHGLGYLIGFQTHALRRRGYLPGRRCLFFHRFVDLSNLPH